MSKASFSSRSLHTASILGQRYGTSYQPVSGALVTPNGYVLVSNLLMEGQVLMGHVQLDSPA